MKLFASVDIMVLRQDSSNCSIASVRFHDCLQGSIEVCKDWRGEESFPEFVKGLLMCMSLNERIIFCQVDKKVCFSTVIDDKSMVIVSKP